MQAGASPDRFIPPTPSPAETGIPKLLLFCSRERLGSRQEGGGSQVRGDSGDSSESPPKAAASSRHCTPGLGGDLLPFVRPSSAPHRTLRTPGMAANSCSAPGAGIAPEHRCIPHPPPGAMGLQHLHPARTDALPRTHLPAGCQPTCSYGAAPSTHLHLDGVCDALPGTVMPVGNGREFAEELRIGHFCCSWLHLSTRPWHGLEVRRGVCGWAASLKTGGKARRAP